MTRRGFINRILKAGLGIIAAGWMIAKRASPRRFVRALRSKVYPGRMKSLGDISKQGKWSG